MELMLDIRIACRKLQIIKDLSLTTIVSSVPALTGLNKWTGHLTFQVLLASLKYEISTDFASARLP